ncbi:MAG: RNA polymerase factor sigma-54, partial [Candidatus Methylomirabilis sp.]|nr:RNA polymerase factor sigma-54 [Deltaproteobacteria bacterium]
RIAQFVIMCLDDNGFLTQSVEEIAEAVGFDAALVREILDEIKDFDPPGVGAADVRESLRLQAERLVGAPVLILAVLDKGFEHLERHRYDLIAKELGVGLEEVKDAVEWIKSLEPRPGRRFGPDTTQYITPDIYVRKIDGEYVIQLNEDGMPKLRISAYYRGLMRNNGKGAEATTRRYINDKFKSAKWFIKSIHERQRTIFRVTESIMKFQRDFLDHGVSRLRPLILRDVADDIGMHESTVSRVTTNKYVHTPQGIYELKYFFKSHVAGESGDVSSEAVKDRIRKIIAAEDPKKPISDQAIAKMLDKEGVTIARRTVAKYRESLGIAQSALRKRLF